MKRVVVVALAVNIDALTSRILIEVEVLVVVVDVVDVVVVVVVVVVVGLDVLGTPGVRRNNERRV